LFASEDDVMGQLIPLVERAEKSIKFMAFSFTHDDLGSAVVDFVNRGGEVQGVFETRGSETTYSELTTFYCEGIPVRQDGNPGTFHHKIIIIDNKIVVTGSLNFSNNGISSNDENALIIYNAEIASLYLEEFERRWAEATAPDPNDLKCK
ncbi:MAG: phospholipase D-like domain-containing protein, partial [Chloroflexota bacterium]|nr:phospholipase D-like domain-containing protein [Chloroflexota bacterium]